MKQSVASVGSGEVPTSPAFDPHQRFEPETWRDATASRSCTLEFGSDDDAWALGRRNVPRGTSPGADARRTACHSVAGVRTVTAGYATFHGKPTAQLPRISHGSAPGGTCARSLARSVAPHRTHASNGAALTFHVKRFPTGLRRRRRTGPRRRTGARTLYVTQVRSANAAAAPEPMRRMGTRACST